MARIRSLARSQDFSKVMRSASPVRGTGASVYSCGSTSGPRLGLAVRAPNAVVRNRIRRRFKEAFRLAASERPCDVVVRADPRSLDVRFQDLVNLMVEAMEGCERPCER